MIRALGGLILAAGLVAGCTTGPVPGAPARAKPTEPLAPKPDPQIQALTGRLDLERYKATIKGLTQFGDRRQGTARNRRWGGGVDRRRRPRRSSPRARCGRRSAARACAA